ncbi:MAG TPA: hypothetical protein VL053_13075, partial [Arachidicoccus sp.]|nr:hypothetical protein [Arachidicoccus sp.]
LIGLDIYLVYGVKNSHLGDGTDNRKGMKMARYTGMGMAVLLGIAGWLHQLNVGYGEDKTLLIISILFALIHIGLYGVHIMQTKRVEND